jgi:hypothetical protein
MNFKLENREGGINGDGINESGISESGISESGISGGGISESGISGGGISERIMFFVSCFLVFLCVGFYVPRCFL